MGGADGPNLNPILLAWRGTLWQGVVGQGDVHRHTFGGPLNLSVHLVPTSERPLHRVLTLDLSDSRLGVRIPNVTLLPLLYGFVYEGCVLEYQVISDEEIRVIDLWPETSLEEWPYEDYPDHFPVRPVQIGQPRSISREKVPELTCQGLPSEAADQLVVVVYPSQTFGISLWGRWGDAEMVEVIFRVEPDTGRVFVRNQCT